MTKEPYLPCRALQDTVDESGRLEQLVRCQIFLLRTQQE